MSSGGPYGRYRVVSSAELLAWIERTFVLPADPEDRAAVRAEVMHELEGAELELIPGDQVVSRSHAQEWVRADLPLGGAAEPSFVFEKKPGVLVRVEHRAPGLLVTHEPGKPAIEFHLVTSL